MTPDQQEALSRRWGGGAISILPLSSGAWAVFGSATNTHHKLLAILESQAIQGQLAHQLLVWAEEGREGYRTRRGQEMELTPKGTRQISQSLDELGL